MLEYILDFSLGSKEDENKLEWKQKVLFVKITIKKIECLEKHTFTEIYSKIKTKRLLKVNSDYPFKKMMFGEFFESFCFVQGSKTSD